MSRELVPSRLPSLGRSEELVRQGFDQMLPPRMNTRETEDKFFFEFALPGYKKENIQVNQHGRRITLEGGEGDAVAEEEGGYSRREFWQARFSRSLTLPENANPASVSPSFRNGILCLEADKVVPGMPAAPRVLEIGD